MIRRPGLLALMFIALAGWLGLALAHDLITSLALGDAGAFGWLYP